MTEQKSCLSDKLVEVLPEVGFVLIVGGIRSGKSALAYGLADYKSKSMPAYVYNLPKDKAGLLPNNIKPLDTMEFPENSVILADEAYLSWYSRSSMSDRNRFIDVFAGLVGQKDIFGIYVTQSARKLELGIVEGVQAIFIKKPSLLQMRLDRPAIREMLEQANKAFRSLVIPHDMTPKQYYKRCTYVIAESFEGMIENSNTVPSFWTEELSKAWKGVSMMSEDKTTETEISDDDFVKPYEEQAKKETGEGLECMICHSLVNERLAGTCRSCFRKWMLSLRKKD